MLDGVGAHVDCLFTVNTVPFRGDVDNRRFPFERELHTYGVRKSKLLTKRSGTKSTKRQDDMRAGVLHCLLPANYSLLMLSVFPS